MREAPLIGRAKELRDVARALRRGRLITVAGPPGIGKTRLAREVQRGLPQRRGAARMAFCDLAPCRGADGVAYAVAAALGVRVEAAPVEAVARALVLRPRTWMLLDNFEHLAPHARETVGAWLEACPDTHWLVTSRVPLGLAEEQVLQLGPLALPSDPRTAARSDAVRLFLGSLSEGTARLGTDDLRIAARIAVQLEGNPLALKIAAAHVGERTLADVADEVARGALAVWTAAAEERHPSLEGAIEGSFSLLDAEELRFLGKLAVFRGRFSAESASAVTGLPLSAARRMLQVMVKKSVVEADDGPLGPYGLLVSIREHALCRLSAEEREAALEAHSLHFAERSLGWSSSSNERGYRAQLGALGAALPDLSAALHRELERDHPESAERLVRLSLGLDGWMLANGPLLVRARILDQVATRCEHLPASPLLAEWHSARALALDAQGRAEEEGEATARALAMATRTGDAHALGRAGLMRALWHGTRGAPADALEALASARVPLGATPDRDTLAHTWLFEGTLHYAAGNIDAALHASIRAEDVLNAGGDAESSVAPSRLLGTALAHRGLYEHYVGQGEEALTSLEKACRINLATGQRRLWLHARWSLGALLHDLGRLEEAIRVLRVSARETHEAEDARLGAFVASTLAQVLEEQGQLGAAEEEHERAVELARRAGFVWVTHAVALLARGAFRAELGRAPDALGDLAEGAEHWHRCRSRPLPADPLASEDALVRLHGARVRLFAEGGESDARRILAEEWSRARTPAGFVRGFQGTGFALRRLHGVLRDKGEPEVPSLGLRLRPEARAVVLPGGRLVDLWRRPIPFRVLVCLVESHHARPGRVVPVPELAAAVWPGERFVEKAERVRVRSAVYALRAAGLRDWVLQEGEGYRLSAPGPTTGNRA